MLWARSMAQGSNNPLLLLELLYTELFSATLPFHNSKATPQLTNHFAERLKPALDHKSCEQSSMQECGVPEALKLTFSPGANSSKEQDVYPCPCSGTKSIPAQGLAVLQISQGTKI